MWLIKFIFFAFVGHVSSGKNGQNVLLVNGQKALLTSRHNIHCCVFIGVRDGPNAIGKLFMSKHN